MKVRRNALVVASGAAVGAFVALFMALRLPNAPAPKTAFPPSTQRSPIPAVQIPHQSLSKPAPPPLASLPRLLPPQPEAARAPLPRRVRLAYAAPRTNLP